ncbi:autotransporter assembly complex protein TamA [Asticcacaulis machinosus]|uniref:BamA/TamA family outer membrane protein n=1 Tax=Asticcacaulis machinosus TaxID=2984211 RepID=A0ABT5HG96_9CAUL|nr:BamA/TamA family outer membrane protein [Asticcacaulis machinosus]MDC7675262.1 BamA/TamA family outer membrane protein [Asticcacaulis machinosus]
MPKTVSASAIALAAALMVWAPLTYGQSAPPVEIAPADAPIITDQDFESALPTLDAPADMTEDPVPDLPPAETPDAETDIALETLPEIPPATDEALTEPLPSLADFDKVPAPSAVAATDEQTPEIAYDTTLNGLKDLNLEKTFWDLSALKEGKGKAANAVMVRARLKQDEILALRLLKAEGYYDATVVTSMENEPNQPGRVRATLTVAPGTPYRLDEIVITAGPTTPPNLIRDALPLKTGDALIADRVVAAEASVSLKLPENGYPFAEVGPRDILLDNTTYTADYTLPVETGPRARIRNFTTEGQQAFGVDHIEIIARFHENDLYDNRMVDDLRQALVATNLFRSVSVEPVRTNAPAPDGTEYVDILVRQQTGRVRKLAADVGFSTGQGVLLKGSWINRNWRPPEGALIVETTLGSNEQTLGVSLRHSNYRKRDLTRLISTELARSDYDTYEAQGLKLGYSLSRSSTPIWQKRWTWSAGIEFSAIRLNSKLDRMLGDSWINYYTADMPLKLARDVTDDLLNPTKDFRASVETTPQVSLSGLFSNNIKNQFDVSTYRQVNDQTILAARFRTGTILGSDFIDVPLTTRFYAGGGGSVRGFGYQELGPRDAANTPTGGLSLIEMAFEARYRFKNILDGNLGVVPFIDAGQVYQDKTPDFNDIRFGIGIGARYYTNFGPIRIDVATPISRRDGESPVSLYVGIGQAF